MKMNGERIKKTIQIPIGFVVLVVIFIALIVLFLYNPNLFPVHNVEVENGVYQYVDGEGEISISDNSKLCFRNFDLNAAIKKGMYYTEDLNLLLGDKEREFYLHNNHTGVYTIEIDINEEESIQIDYYPRDDKLELLSPGESEETTYCFQLKQ